MADRAKADRLRQAMEVARAGTAHDSWVSVAIASGVSSTTIENWIYGRTKPRLRELSKVADELRINPLELEAAYEGMEPPKAPLDEEIRDLNRQMATISGQLAELIVLQRAVVDRSFAAGFVDAVAARRPASAPSRGEPPSASDE